MFRDVPGCSGMFRRVPECSMFRVLSTPLPICFSLQCRRILAFWVGETLFVFVMLLQPPYLIL